MSDPEIILGPLILTPDGTVEHGFTEGEIDSLREAQKDFFPDLVTIRKKVYDEHDFVTQTRATDVPCRITPGGGTFQEIAERMQCLNPYTVSMAYDQEVEASDQLIDQEGTIYEVRAVRKAKSYITATRLLAEAVV